MTEETIKQQLEEATDLLEVVHDVLDDVHMYDSDIYREIGIFLDGES